MKHNKLEKDLKEYLSEHLNYERAMLKYTWPKLFTKAGYDWCVVFECFGLHARNLRDFLKNQGNGSNTFRACDYVANFKARDTGKTIEKMNQSFFHLSSKRLDDTPINLDDLASLAEWIDENWEDWASQLPTPYNKLADPLPACPVKPIHIASATNHITVVKSHSTFTNTVDSDKSVTFTSEVNRDE